MLADKSLTDSQPRLRRFLERRDGLGHAGRRSWTRLPFNIDPWVIYYNKRSSTRRASRTRRASPRYRCGGQAQRSRKGVSGFVAAA